MILPLRFPVLVLLGFNLLVCLLYGWDKLCARRGWWRVPERTLLLLAALGGGAGALIGMYAFRHKTRKPRFALGVPAILLAELALIWVGRWRGFW